MFQFLKPNKTKIILSVIIIGIIAFSFSALAAWEVPGRPNGIPDKDLDQVVLDITDWILGFAGILALLFIIWGGIQYTTSAGNENQMDNAKKTLKWGIGGLVICGLSYAIISVVVGVWLGGSSSSVDPCTLTASDLDTAAECSAAGCDWITNTQGCCNIGLNTCGYPVFAVKVYGCSTRATGGSIQKWNFEACGCPAGCACSWCCCE